MEEQKDLILRPQEAKNPDLAIDFRVTNKQLADFGVELFTDHVMVEGQVTDIIGDIGSPEVPDDFLYFGPDITYISLTDDRQNPNRYLILTLRYKDGSTKKYHLSRNLEHLIEEVE